MNAINSEIEKNIYPIGRFVEPLSYPTSERRNRINIIESLPERFELEVSNLIDFQLDTRYRPGGWTIRQVINHLSDSHMNAFIRFKLTLTEDLPSIKPYDENLWSDLPDAKYGPIAPSLTILKGVHQKWAAILRRMSSTDFEKSFYHSEAEKTYSLNSALALYSYHGDHHLAQIVRLKERLKW